MLVNFVSFAVAISLLTIKRNNDIIRFAKIEKRDIMSEYWLIPMDFLVCNFDKLQKEYRKNGKIMWEIPGKPKKTQQGFSVKHLITATTIKPGDIIFFYVCNIPTYTSTSSKARILLRGEVYDAPQALPRQAVYVHDEIDNHGNDLISGISISNLTTLTKKELEEDRVFDRDWLKKNEQYWPQGKRWPNTYNNNFKKGVIKELESKFKTAGIDHDFYDLIKHFNKQCFFSGKLGPKSHHLTFKRRNGTDYYEIHHFIQQHSSQKADELSSIVYSEENCICLCSNCHNKLHYGDPIEINLMLEELWNDPQIRDMLQRNNFKGKIGAADDDEALSWIKCVYRSNLDRQKKDNDNI